MITRYRDPRVAVIDEFLSGEEQQEILKYLDRAVFRRVLPEAWGHAYRILNGEPLVGVEVVSMKRGLGDKSPSYPMGNALDVIVERITACRKETEETMGEGWSYFTLCPYVYAAGSGLGWHADSHCMGAFIYYAHPTWSPHWGGELLVEYGTEDCAAYSVSSRGLLRNSALDTALANGLGYYFAPLPNRLILLRSRTPHMIKPVEPAAGEHTRLSLTGFFFSAAAEFQG
jgi:hypothetical protein